MVSEHGVGIWSGCWRSSIGLGATAIGKPIGTVDYAKLYIEHISQYIDEENVALFPMLESAMPEVKSSKTVEEIERENDYEGWMKALEELKTKYAT